MIAPSAIHLLLTYKCISECDHCFVWGGPAQEGTMTSETVDRILRQCMDAGGIEWIWFEGGEPFLFLGLLEWSVRRASGAGFKVGLVTNGYWAVSAEDALLSLRPLQPYLSRVDVSRDDYHSQVIPADRPDFAVGAARRLGVPAGLMAVAPALAPEAPARRGVLPQGESRVMCRGRAAVELAPGMPLGPVETFDECPHENLKKPERLHLDAFGCVQICQGISIGNIADKPLQAIFRDYDPYAHPITVELLRGGPALLARTSGLSLKPGYADACHLCYETRAALRRRYPDVLAPDPMYGPPTGDPEPEKLTTEA